MNCDEVEIKLRNILKKNLTILGLTGVTVDSIKKEDNLIDEVGIDSVGIMGLVADIEKEFDMKMGEGDLNLANFATLESIQAYIHSKIL